jgi:L-alanine-DL-glutamate epimerase-like enolase superfamily enzyme
LPQKQGATRDRVDANAAAYESWKVRITGVKTTLFRTTSEQRDRNAQGSAGTSPSHGCVIELGTDEGFVGVAICSVAVPAQLKQITDELLTGEDPRCVTGLWQRMVNASYRGGPRGFVKAAIAALDVALWDLKAKANQEPLWKTLGGARPKVNAYASGLDIQATDAALHDAMSAMAKKFGFCGGKLKVGLDPDADLRRLGIIRQALLANTAEPELMIDAGQYDSPKQAIRRVREIEMHVDLTWVEEPARRWDFLGLKRVSNSIRSAVCAGESLDAPGDFLPHFQCHALDVVQVDAASVGITGALQIADTAFGFELPVTLSRSPGNMHAHLGAVMPYCMSMAVVDPVLLGGVFTGDVRIEGGWAVAGDRPGNGLVIDQQALAKASGTDAAAGRVA